MESTSKSHDHPRIFLAGDVASGKTTAGRLMEEHLKEKLGQISRIRIDDIHQSLYPKDGPDAGIAYSYDADGMLTFHQREVQIPRSISHMIGVLKEQSQSRSVISEMSLGELAYCIKELRDEMRELIRGACVMHINVPAEVRVERNRQRFGAEKVPEEWAKGANHEFTSEMITEFTEFGAVVHSIENNIPLDEYRVRILQTLTSYLESR